MRESFGEIGRKELCGAGIGEAGVARGHLLSGLRRVRTQRTREANLTKL